MSDNLPLYINLDFPVPVFKENFLKFVLERMHLVKDYRCLGIKNTDALTKEFIQLMERSNLSLVDSILFCCPPKCQSTIHKDISSNLEWNGKYCYTGIIFNLSGHAGTLEWHDRNNGIEGLTEVGTNYERWEEENLIGKYEGILPALIRTNIAHRAVNNSEDQYRLSYTCRFINNPTFEEAQNKLSEFIKQVL